MGNLLARCSPSLVTAVALLSGVVGARLLGVAVPTAAVALLGASLAARGTVRHAAVGLSLGLLAVWGRPPSLDPVSEVVVAATVERVGPWRVAEGRWSGRARLLRATVGGRTSVFGGAVFALLPAEAQTDVRELRVRGRLRPARRAANLVAGLGSRRSRVPVLSVGSARLVEETASPPGPFARGLGAWRRLLVERIDSMLGERPAAGVVKALGLGDARALGDPVLRGLRRVGLAHVVALSGLHLGLVAMTVAGAGRRLSPGPRAALVIAVASGYLLLAGARPSLVRSWWMVGAVILSLAVGRSPRPGHALLWAAVVLAVHDPWIVSDPSYQLTFAATAGIVSLHRLASGLAGAPGPSQRGGTQPGLVETSLAAQTATLPFALPLASWLPSWAWLWNLLYLPLIAATTLVALCLLVLLSIAPEAAPLPALGLDVAAAVLSAPAGLPPALAGGRAWPPAGPPWGWLAAVVWLGWRRRHPRLAVVTAVTIALVAVGAPGEGGERSSGEAVVHFLDVGQGDSAVLQVGDAALLIDAGGWRSSGIASAVLVPALGRLGVRRIEVLVVSHGDRDHCGGAEELSEAWTIGEVWMHPATARSACGRRLLSRPGVTVRPLWRGMELAWRGWSVEVLSPQAGTRASGNEGSLVLRTTRWGRRVLWTGDLERSGERELLRHTPQGSLRADLLKVAHHGSASSTDLPWLRAVRPRFAVISCGRGNPFGHPAELLQRRLHQQGVRWLSTARAGRVTVRWREKGAWHVSTPAAPP